jgi:outer membrane protein insertion porin family
MVGGARVGGDGEKIPVQLVGAKIVRVEVRGNVAVPEEVVRAVLVGKVGDVIDREAIAEDVRRVWGLEAFDDVGAEVEAVKGGAVLRWVVVERALIGTVRVHGAGGRRIEGLAGGLYDPVRVAREVDGVAVRLRERGHLQARARAWSRRAGERVDVCAVVDAGPRYEIDRVAFPGSKQIGERDLRAALRTRDGAVNAPGGVYRADLLVEDKPYLLALYYERGMVDVRVGDPVITLDAARGRVRVAVPVQEGPVYRIGKLTVAGVQARERNRLLGPLARGRVFARAEVAEANQRMQDWLKARGRERAVWPETRIDAERRTIDLTFDLETP